MGADQPSFRTGAVRPIECLREGWELIRGHYWLFVGITLVACLLAYLAPFGVLAGPMFCGLYLCFSKKQRGEPFKFETLFKGFDYFVQSLIATLLMMIPMFVVIIPGYAVVFGVLFATMPMTPPPGGGPPPKPDMTAFFVAYFVFIAVLIAVSLVVAVLAYFVYPLIVDRKLSGVQALKTSVRAAMANLGGVTGLVLLNFLMTMVGMLACYVGAIFVLPFHFAAVAVAYRKVFPVEAAGSGVKSPEELDYDDQPDLEARPPEGGGPPVP